MSEIVPNNTKNANVTSDEIDHEVAIKLRGDAIGDTMYSQRFVLQTLLKLDEVEWLEELEEDLCFLWDTTVERDVCIYLFELSYPSIACNLLNKYNAVEYSRLFEIVIGILANILSADCEKHISDLEISIITEQLYASDAFIVAQTLRFLSAIAYSKQKLSTIDKYVMDRVEHILHSTSNVEILEKALDAVSKLTCDTKISEDCINGSLIKLCIEMCIKLLKTDKTDEFEIYTSNLNVLLKSSISIICNYCVYANQSNSQRLVGEMLPHHDLFSNFIHKLIGSYTAHENLLAVSKELIYYIEAVNYIVHTLSIPYSHHIFIDSFIILSTLIQNESLGSNEFLELVCYFIHVGTSDKILKDLAYFKVKNVHKVFKFIMTKNLDFGFNYKENLSRLI